MTTQEAAHFAMRELWEQGDTYLREAVERGEVDSSLPLVRIETPGGLEIRRFGDLLEIEADFEEVIQGARHDVTYRVEWDWDIRELPTVTRDVWNGNQARPWTVARREFPIIARNLGALVANSL